MRGETLQQPNSVLRNIGAVGLTRGIALLLDGAAYVAVARYLGPELYGHYLGFMALAVLFDFAADMAVVDVTVREIATETGSGNKWLIASTVLRLVMAAIFVVVFAAYVYRARGSYPPDVLNGAWIVALVLPVGALRMPLAVFRARQQSHFELIATVAARAANLIFVLLAIAAGTGIVPFFAIAVASRLLLASVAWGIGFTRAGFSITRQDFNTLALRRLIGESIPMAVSGLFVALQLRGDILMVAHFMGPHSAGVYGVVASLPEYFLLVPVIMTTPVLPLLSQLFAEASLRRFGRVYRTLISVLSALIVPIAVIGALLPERVVTMLFGAEYVDAAVLLPWLMASIVCMWISHATAIATVAIGWQRAFLWIQSICLVAFVALNLLLIPALGLVGSAIARLVATLIAPVLTYWVVMRYTGAGLDTRAFGQVALAGFVMAVVVRSIEPFGPLLATFVAMTVYVGSLWATGFMQNVLINLKES